MRLQSWREDQPKGIDNDLAGFVLPRVVTQKEESQNMQQLKNLPQNVHWHVLKEQRKDKNCYQIQAQSIKILI